MPQLDHPADRAGHSRALLAAVRAGGPDRSQARESLVHLHAPLVEHCVARFRDRGEPYEDLVQVGMIGLLNAIDRFEPDRGLEFSSFAIPTILGEIKRHFRDKGWMVRVPRRLQELSARISGATAELTQDLGHSPTAAELAAHLGCSVEEVLDGLGSAGAYATISLDAADADPDGVVAALAGLGAADEALDHVEIRESVRPLLEGLDPREKQILLMRFFRTMTQAQIAGELGISQVHVSRLLARTLDRLRGDLDVRPAATSAR